MYQVIHPMALLLLVLPIGTAFYFFKKQRSNESCLPLSGPNDLLLIHNRNLKWIFRITYSSLLSAFCILIFVIARPVKIESRVQKTAEGIDIMLVLDVSESMEATDFEPSRIEVEKAVITDFIKRRSEDRIGLTLFGGEAITRSPLTRDYEFLLSQVSAVRLRELKQGTAIGMAIATAVAKLRHSESKSRVLVLLTDGDSNVGTINPITAAYLAKEEKIKIYSIGIGKDNRVIVPIYAYDAQGKRTHLVAQVPSYLNPQLLQEIAQITDGKAFMAKDKNALEQILTEIDRLEKTKYKISPIKKMDEHFFPFAALAMVLLFITYVLLETRYQTCDFRATSL